MGNFHKSRKDTKTVALLSPGENPRLGSRRTNLSDMDPQENTEYGQPWTRRPQQPNLHTMNPPSAIGAAQYDPREILVPPVDHRDALFRSATSEDLVAWAVAKGFLVDGVCLSESAIRSMFKSNPPAPMNQDIESIALRKLAKRRRKRAAQRARRALLRASLKEARPSGPASEQM